MKLSICIPTYNRDKFLLKNLESIASQIREGHLEKEVEINVSNNGSTDRTKELVLQFFDKNSDLQTTYRENKINEGPDANYIQTMHMANGEYSIMLGDDDYFIDGGIKHVLGIICANKDADIFISNRHEIDEDGKILRTRYFVREDIYDRLFDFSDINQAGYYLALCKEVGGCMTFISSVIYKTAVLKQYGEYDGSLDGTYYSFWFYWWRKLFNGGKLFYNRLPYIKCTMPRSNNNFGTGINRVLVEFKGFSSFADNYDMALELKIAFLKIPQRSFTVTQLADLYSLCSNVDQSIFIEYLRKCYWSDEEIVCLQNIVSTRQSLKRLLVSLFPSLYNFYVRMYSLFK